ncbi:DUF3325 domain-containing protein [Pseudoxanthomonas suwonensis]|uniref:DUF3325 domain-containing protein n=1 Tax=Pseudoxanthomonas suwonensis TaxID=314722 RepID=A0A0E3YZJ8_9GAMM|nr:DUF3325 domain-containing protein [Pseudoxanthomonas suwonensis]AKC85628.1 hypothetical protein WQ53_01445 [Pseudoxanthomonas suwonensis]
MPESVHAAWLLGGALLACTAGVGWLALAMPGHAQQVWGAPVPRATARILRVLGALGLAASLALCLAADHASMAVLVWAMALAAAALTVAFALAWRPHWLRVLAPWRQAPQARQEPLPQRQDGRGAR